jgi:hypothetical protein
MFDDVEDNVHLGLWAAAGVAALLLAGVFGGLWVREWQQARSAKTASTPSLNSLASAARLVNPQTEAR